MSIVSILRRCGSGETFQPVELSGRAGGRCDFYFKRTQERYEVFTGVKITDSALVKAAATLSNRYGF